MRLIELEIELEIELGVVIRDIDYCMLFSIFCSIEIVIGCPLCNDRNVVLYEE